MCYILYVYKYNKNVKAHVLHNAAHEHVCLTVRG